MVRKTKWIEQTSPDEPFEKLARRALEARLDLVWHYLPRAADKPNDPDNVHQLRVSTRRAMAAMEIFDSLLPKRRASWFNKQLKRVRQAAGQARDLDVLLARIKQRQATGNGRYAGLVEYVEWLRDEAQEPIEEIYRKLSRKNYSRRQSKLLKRVRIREESDSDQPSTFADAARLALGRQKDHFFAAASADLHDHMALHALRIQGKQLRYTMEIFSGAFGPSLKHDVYPIVVDFQERLGKLNDHATARDLFIEWVSINHDAAAGEVLNELIAEERRLLDESQQEFFAWWTAERSADLRRRIDNLLNLNEYGQSA
jgi:CHAD domain-containing protein